MGRCMTRTQSKILDIVSQPGGASSIQLAKMTGGKRGQIFQDISALRRMGYPIRTSAMVVEDGMYVAVFEL